MEGSAMTHKNEIPSDGEVCAVLQRLGTVSARALVEELSRNHSSRDSQRAVQRCLDRGKIQLGAGLRLSVRTSSDAVAA
jgi:hypothetical protein